VKKIGLVAKLGSGLKKVSRRGFELIFMTFLMLHQSDFSLMQGVAWLGMFSYSAQETSLEKALEQTFDGQNPCDLCHFIQESQNQKDSEHLPESVKKKKSDTSFSLQKKLSLVSHKIVKGNSADPYKLTYLRLKSQCHFEVDLPPPKV
jgi:hypothetical protein